MARPGKGFAPCAALQEEDHGSARVPTQGEATKVERTGIDPPRVAG
jgi:hypothetical protein